MTEPDPRALTRADFDAIRPVPTRWSDNDMFGHLNNAVYLELFDSVLNAWMQAETGIDENTAPTLGVEAPVTGTHHRGAADLGCGGARRRRGGRGGRHGGPGG